MNRCRHDLLEDCPACAKETIDALVRRVAALELIIAEEVSPFDCRDDLNRMLVEEICNRTPVDVGSPVLTHENE